MEGQNFKFGLLGARYTESTFATPRFLSLTGGVKAPSHAFIGCSRFRALGGSGLEVWRIRVSGFRLVRTQALSTSATLKLYCVH